jgi:cytochrome c oxidase accessory protein FixG
MARVRLPIAEGTGALRSDGSRPRIIPADVVGRFTRARRLVGLALILFAGALPWLRMNGAPALFVDVDTRRLFAFGKTFNAQDGPLLFFVVTGIGFSLFVVATLFGRMWCGWTCPQTVILDALFRPVERLIEGTREARVRREAGPWTVDRTARLLLKHAVFVVLAIALAHGVLAYFVSAPGVFAMVRGAPGRHLEAFAWTTAMAAVIYFDFAIFREQLCLGVCPYGRLQGALVDPDTITIGYDATRGEPRGKAGHAEGACLDCGRCVVVCPTGIDIREGAQLDCVGCAACVDACDDVMERAKRPRGLVRYDSLEGFSGRARRLFRPRVALYGVLLVIGGVVATTTVHARHTDGELTVTRLAGAPYELDGDRVRNSLDAHVVSKLATAGTYALTVDAPPGTEVVMPMRQLTIEGMGSAHAPIFLTAPRSLAATHPIVRVTAAREGSPEVVHAEIVLLGPAR